MHLPTALLSCCLLAAVLHSIGAAPLQPAELQFRLHPINAASTCEACSVMDVNHDGTLDIVCGGFWYEAPRWKKHFVREVEKLGNPPDFDGYSHLELDVNRDGWTDVNQRQLAQWFRILGRASPLGTRRMEETPDRHPWRHGDRPALRY